MGGARVPEEYRVLSRGEVADRLGVTVSALATSLHREQFDRVPEPDGRLGRSPYWYEATVRRWERGAQQAARAGRWAAL